MSAQHERGGLGLAKFGTARAVRAGGGPFVDLSLIQKAQEASDKGGKSDPIRTWSRRSMILPEFVGLTFNVYNGKSFVPIRILGSMIGRKLGDFAPITTGLSTENAKRKMGD
ncbi:MAG: 30S ribosomal protein S19 [Pseudomonadota bacterium]